MSNNKIKKTGKIRIFWEKYEKRVVLILGILIVAGISFELGILQGHKINPQPMIIEKAPEQNLVNSLSQKTTLAKEADSQAKKMTPSANSSAEGVMAKKDCAFVGSKNSDKYHKPDCHWVARIKPENIVCFKDAQDAKNKGYVPDSSCTGN